MYKLCVEDTDEEENNGESADADATQINDSNVGFHLELNQSTYSGKNMIIMREFIRDMRVYVLNIEKMGLD